MGIIMQILIFFGAAFILFLSGLKAWELGYKLKKKEGGNVR